MSLTAWQRWSLLGLGVWSALLTAGFILQWGWVIALWPWRDGRLSYIFVGSIAAAVGASALWLALKGDRSMLAPPAANLSVMLGGMSVFLFVLEGRRNEGKLMISAVVCLAGAVLSVVIWRWAHGAVPRNALRAPPPLRWFCGFAACVLVGAGAALVLQAERIFPWPLNPDSSVMYGLIFLGDACFFLYPLIRPLWSWASAQLAAFLAYDLVLIPVMLGHIDDVPAGHELSLVVYLTALCLSAAVAIFYLFISPSTRLTAPSQSPTVQAPVALGADALVGREIS